MGKRVTAAIFIILANMVLFVHAVVPHHHHDSDLCFETFSNQQKTIAKDCCQTNEESKHQDDSDKDSDNCFLTNIVALFSGEIKQNIRVDINSRDLLSNAFMLSGLAGKNCTLSCPGYFVEIVSHDHKSNYFSLACSAFGLRAPPHYC